jgi:ADP-ribose pyrophosphatase YjhB (NUDIX family)
MTLENEIIAFSFQARDDDNNTIVIDYQIEKNEFISYDRSYSARFIGKIRGTDDVETLLVHEEAYVKIVAGDSGSEQTLQTFMEDKKRTPTSYTPKLHDIIIKTVPRRFKFENQKTTDHIITTPSSDKDDGLMAFGYRVFAPIGWGFAGGMIESGEDAKANSEKEIDEEMNIRPQDVISSTSLGNYDVEEVRGTANTALFRLEVTEERMRALEAGSDVEETMILDKKELEEFLKTRSNEMVPHHLDMLIEQARMGNIPSWASTVITGVFPEDNNKRSK